MAPINHVFTSPQADVADPTLIKPSAWNSAHAYTLQDAVSLAGNTAGVLGNISSGTLVLAGGNNVTLSQNGNSVTVSGAAAVAQSEQTQSRFNLTLSGNTAGALALISSGVMTLAGGNNVTLSQAGNAVTVSAAATVAQTEQTQSRFNLTLGGNTDGALALISSGVMTLAGGNNITLSQAGNAVTVSAAATAAQTAQTQNVHNVTLAGNTAGVLAQVSSGTLTLAGGNNITLSQAGNAITISAGTAGGAQTEQTQNRFNLTLSGNTAGVLAQVSSGTLTLAGGNNITLSQAGNVVTISGVATVAQTVQTQNIVNVTLSGNTAGALAHISSGTMTLAGGNNITLSQAGNAVTVSAASQTVQTQSRFNVTLGGNTAGALALVSSGVLTWAGGNNITLSQAGNAVTVSGAATVAQSVQTQNIVNVTLSGNTAGVLAHVSSGTLTLAGGNNITLSQNGNAVTISGATAGGVPIATTVQSVASANSVGTVTRYAAEDHRHAGLYQISVGGNTAGATTAGAGSLMLAGGNNITLSGATAAGGMTLSVAAAGAGGGVTLSRSIIPDHQFSGTVGAAMVNGSMSIQHVIVPQHLTMNYIAIYGQVSVNTAANLSSAYFDYTLWAGIYQRVGDTLNRLSSGVNTNDANVAWWTSNATLSIQGPRAFYCAMDAYLTPGEYHIMCNLSTANTATGGANTTALGNSVSLFGGTQIASGTANIFNAAALNNATASTNNVYYGMGMYTSTMNAVPAVISLSGINGMGTAIQRANIVMDLVYFT